MVECLPLDPAAKVRFPPRAVGIFLHPVTNGGHCGGPWLVFQASLSRKCPGITAWSRVDSGTNQFKAGKYVVGIGKYNTLLLPCGRSRLLQRRGRVFAFKSCGPGSIPTLGSCDFSAPCDIWWPVCGSTAWVSGITQDEMSQNYRVVPSRFGDESI